MLLVTNDRENKRKATEEGISAETSMSISSFSIQVVLLSNIRYIKSSAVLLHDVKVYQ